MDWSVVGAAAGAFAVSGVVTFLRGELFERSVSSVRERLKREIFRVDSQVDAALDAGMDRLYAVVAERLASTDPRQLEDLSEPGRPSEISGPTLPADPPTPLEGASVVAEAISSEAASRRFALLLIEYYAYGLTQAKRSLSASLASSAVGAAALIGGVTLAFLHPNDGLTVPIVTSLAGVLTTGIGTLFHRQATQALKHMEGQSRGLRQDMKAERDSTQAIALLAEVDNPQLKARLQAALILKLSGAKLPDAEAGNEPLTLPAQNGNPTRQ